MLYAVQVTKQFIIIFKYKTEEKDWKSMLAEESCNIINICVTKP